MFPVLSGIAMYSLALSHFQAFGCLVKWDFFLQKVTSRPNVSDFAFMSDSTIASSAICQQRVLNKYLMAFHFYQIHLLSTGWVMPDKEEVMTSGVELCVGNKNIRWEKISAI